MRLCALSTTGTYADDDRWLAWQQSTRTWEPAEDPRHATLALPTSPMVVLRLRYHHAPEDSTLDHEKHLVEPDLDPEPVPSWQPDRGYDLGGLD